MILDANDPMIPDADAAMISDDDIPETMNDSAPGSMWHLDILLGDFDHPVFLLREMFVVRDGGACVKGLVRQKWVSIGITRTLWLMFGIKQVSFRQSLALFEPQQLFHASSKRIAPKFHANSK